MERRNSHRFGRCPVHHSLASAATHQGLQDKIHQRHFHGHVRALRRRCPALVHLGLLVNDLPIIIANSLAFVQAIVILAFKAKYK
jgi:hypothetical protein